MKNRHSWLLLLRVCGAVALLIPTLFPIPFPVLLTLSLLAYLLVGYDVLLGSLRSLCRARLLDESFLMTLSTVAALALGEYFEAVAVMLFYQVGEWFAGLAVTRTRRATAALAALCPDTATVLREGGAVRVPTEQIAVGEILRVLPGERIPLDGTVTEGVGEVDTASLTGEPLPVTVGPQDSVAGGTVALNAPLSVKVLRAYEESTVQRILTMVEDATERKARADRFITRFARYYTPAVILAALLVLLIPSLITGEWSVWLYRSLSFLVVSCPCALVLSVPLSFFSGIGAAARAGVLFKGANAIEALATCDTAVFDKTGTLTSGAPCIAGAVPADGVGEEELLKTAAAVLYQSNHPLARATVGGVGIPEASAEAVREIAGQGVLATVGGVTCAAGNARLLAGRGVACPEVAGTVVHVARGSEYLGHIALTDALRPEASEVITALRRAGVRRTVMLTGDSEAAASSVAAALGIDEVHAGLLPEDKVAAMERLLAEGARPFYLGDGINDAPVLARATVGIAMQELSEAAASDAADVLLVGRSLNTLTAARAAARHTRRTVTLNIVLSLTVKLAILLLSSLGLTGLHTAIFGDVGVLVLAVLNATRAGRVRRR